MNWIDIVLLIPIVYGIIRGIIKGAVLEVSSFIGVILGILIARSYAPSFAEYIIKWFDFSSIENAKLISFVIIFVFVAVCLHIIALMIDKILKIILLEWLNRLLGGIFGCIKFIIILSVFINFFHFVNKKIDFVSKQSIENSMLYKPVKKIIPTILPYCISEKQ